MRTKSGAIVSLVIVAIVGIALLTWGGLWVRGELRCQALEDEYLNHVSAARQSILIRELAPESEAMEEVSSGLVDDEVGAATQRLNSLYEECGVEAGRTASRKGSAIVLRGAE